ncbi:NUDIX pyrophosphatase [Mycoplasmatota bacterium WC44]
MRAFFQVLVIPYRINYGSLEFAILKRSDLLVWQGVAGGGEDDETPHEAAKRETCEELNICDNVKFISLDTKCSIPTSIFENIKRYRDKGIYVIDEFCFGVEVEANFTLELSQEHSEFKWCTYKEAYELLEWDSNKTALWELNERLTDLNFT